MCRVSQLEMNDCSKNAGIYSYWFEGAEPLPAVVLQIIGAQVYFIGN
jgi:hypothetical protein